MHRGHCLLTQCAGSLPHAVTAFIKVQCALLPDSKKKIARLYLKGDKTIDPFFAK